jgi:trk system potassium uptake protein TrkA
MKIVIAGIGQIGTYLAKMLVRRDHDITVIDEKKEKLDALSTDYDVLTVNGSASSIEVLEQANVQNSDLYIAVTKHQEVNIISSILAKKLGAKKTLARIDNNEYVVDEHRKIITELGVDSLIYPEILASDEIVNIVRHPSMIKTVEFAGGKLVLFTLKVAHDNPIAGKTLVEVAREYEFLKARVVALSRGNRTIIPRGRDKVLPGDIIYIITDKDGLEQVKEILRLPKFNVRNIMILGGSRIGLKAAMALENDYYIKIFEKDKAKSEYLADVLHNALVINSEARDADFLIDEGIEQVDVFIAVTGNSEINILSSLLAKRLGVKLTITQVENIDYFELAKNMDLDFIINKKLIAASHIFAHTIGANVASVQCFSDTEAEVLEFVVPEGAKITRKKLSDIDFPEGAIIGGGQRNGEVFIAVGDTRIQPGDRVVVFALPDVVDRVARFFK